MGWTDYEGGLGEVVASPRESDRFGYSIARVTVGTGWQESATTVGELALQLWERVAASSADIVIVRFPSELAQLPSGGATLPGWTTIPAGSIVYWSQETGQSTTKVSSDSEVIAHKAGSQAAEFDASPFLKALDDSFADYTSHYSANPLLDSTLVSAGYREWAESTIRDPNGLVYGLADDGRMIGVAVARTLDVADGAREIELAGMVSDAQGGGRYRHLLQALADDAHADGVRSLFISTQSYNIRVQRVWASVGYQPVQSIDTLHVVRSPLLGQASRAIP